MTFLPLSEMTLFGIKVEEEAKCQSESFSPGVFLTVHVVVIAKMSK